MKGIRVAVLILIFALMPIGLAQASEPPTSITIDTVKVYRNLAELGDSLYMFHYSMPYDSDNWSPTVASESTIFTLYDTNGSTVKQTGSPFVVSFFGSNGYGDGVGSFYFGASDNAPAWDAAVEIRIAGLPAYYTLAGSYVLSSSDYVTETTQVDNRLLFKNYILLECDKLATSYSDTGITLKGASDSGIVLSAFGELYFRGVVDGLQALCPELFFIQTLIPEVMAVETYDMSLMDTYTGRLAADDLGDGFTGIGALVGGIGGAFVAAIMTFGGVFALCIWTSKKGWGAEIGLLGGGVITVGMALLVGDIVFMIMMILSLLATIGVVWLVLMKKA